MERKRHRLGQGILTAKKVEIIEPTRAISAELMDFDFANTTGELSNVRGQTGIYFYGAEKLRVLGPAVLREYPFEEMFFRSAGRQIVAGVSCPVILLGGGSVTGGGGGPAPSSLSLEQAASSSAAARGAASRRSVTLRPTPGRKQEIPMDSPLVRIRSESLR